MISTVCIWVSLALDIGSAAGQESNRVGIESLEGHVQPHSHCVLPRGESVDPRQTKKEVRLSKKSPS